MMFRSTLCLALGLLAMEANGQVAYELVPNWLTPPPGMETIGNSHGEIAVDSKGNIYVSVEGEKSGIQVYHPDGKYSHNVPGLPGTLHGFVIKNDLIYASVLGQQKVIKTQLDGKVLLEIPKESFPEEKRKKADGSPRGLALTSVDVAPNGDIYVVDGYGEDWIFQFDKDGKFKSVFGGRGAPWNLKNCHKIFIDPRYAEPRILCCDRVNLRLLHLGLDGSIIGEHATGLRRPSSASFHGDLVAIAEIDGRVSVIDKEGKSVATLGQNDTNGEKNTNNVEPAKWRQGICTGPHGITFDAQGNLLMAEWNKWGRVLRWNLKK
ncbi:MAG: hypothetical protein DVB23_000578 [Verrucomicrobia bacterium]|jgi:hypothetical protein|nr:MAG: hypothetical protein DVB23_000578 [Verrucomicrobiota bacterium]